MYDILCVTDLSFLLVILCFIQTYQSTEVTSQPSKIVKNRNENLILKCTLMDSHDKFNQNASVTWWFKRSCKNTCWNQAESPWTEIQCNGPCKPSLELNDLTATNGFYLCKISPYLIDNEILNIQVTRTFEVTIFGKFIL